MRQHIKKNMKKCHNHARSDYVFWGRSIAIDISLYATYIFNGFLYKEFA